MQSIQLAETRTTRSPRPGPNTRSRQEIAAAISARFDAQRASLASKYADQLQVLDMGRTAVRKLTFNPLHK